MNKIILLIFGIVFFIFCFLKGVYVLDPDFGWHLRMGQLILSSGIPLRDPFSYTMSTYPFVDHEWLTNVIIYLLYAKGGMVAVSLLFATTLCLTVFLLTNNNNRLFEIIILISVSLLGFGGVRPQVLGWLFFALWIREISKRNPNVGRLFLIQLMWVNMHGSFFLGIVTYGVWASIEFLSKKRKKFPLFSCVVLFFATLINPYTYRIWWEVFMQLTDGSLRWRVMEWLPGVFIFDIPFWIYSCIFLSLCIKFHSRLSLFQKTALGTFFLMALSTARNMPLFLILSSESFFVLWKALERSVPPQKKGLFMFLKKSIVGICISVSFVSVILYCFSYKPIDSIYPEKALRFIVQNKMEGNTFSLYGWGGYIIWKAPNNKVFIDGRMPSWRWEQKDVRQSDNADKEYRKIINGEVNFLLYQKKYNIKYILVDKDKKTQLIFKKYKKIYEDETTVLYRV